MDEAIRQRKTYGSTSKRDHGNGRLDIPLVVAKKYVSTTLRSLRLQEASYTICDGVV
jgi:hypothetical protein